MARKIIIDGDMGTDDAVALCLLLNDPRVEILAITATEGCVTADQANSNLQALLGELDPDRYPRLGMATPGDDAPAINTTFLYGADGLGNTGFEVSAKQHLQVAEKLIIDFVRQFPGEVTILTLGPLTNLARALRRDPSITELINRVVITGGSVVGVGNITAAAEFNFFFDPLSARQVLQSRVTKTLVPLDVTRQVQFGIDFLQELPDISTRVGCLLKQVLPFAFRAYRQQLGLESITLNDAVGALALIEPDLFEYAEMAGDVETEGEITRGMTVFDRRSPQEWRTNLEVATSVRADAARQSIADLLQIAANQ